MSDLVPPSVDPQHALFQCCGCNGSCSGEGTFITRHSFYPMTVSDCLNECANWVPERPDDTERVCNYFTLEEHHVQDDFVTFYCDLYNTCPALTTCQFEPGCMSGKFESSVSSVSCFFMQTPGRSKDIFRNSRLFAKF